MSKYKKTASLVLVSVLIIISIILIENTKNEIDNEDVEVVDISTSEDKSDLYESAKDITTPDGFINTDPFSLKDLIGDKVILIDFWTYSCINCQRTTPYLNAWHKEYEDDGLVIVGIHTPEFGFEREYDNVLKAVEELGIEFPVVLDNDYSTWQAYRNRYWPRKYLIDIDGYIVYDHIGEGAYEETEKEIQKALEERAQRLGIQSSFSNTVSIESLKRNVGSPEIYFGAWRNEYLGNGEQGIEGTFSFDAPENIVLNKLYLEGGWTIEDKFARSNGNSSVIFRYRASKVHMVLGSKEEKEISIYKDDTFYKKIKVNQETLYTLIDDEVSGEHTIRIDLPKDVDVFTFTFG